MLLNTYTPSDLLRSFADEQAEFAIECAQRAKQQGEYEQARELLSAYWSDIGSSPNVSKLSDAVQSRMILTIGELTSALGVQRRMKGAQRIARDLLRAAKDGFSRMLDAQGIAEATCELGYTFYREGRFDIAREVLAEAAATPGLSDTDTIAFIKLRQSLVEYVTKNSDLALHLLQEAAPLFSEESTGNKSLQGSYHNTLGYVLLSLGTNGRNPVYTDHAFIEFHAAQFYFQTAGHTRFEAAALNNLGFILFTQGQFEEAHDFLNRARSLFISLDDAPSVAQVDDTRSRVYAAQGDTATALKLINAAVVTLRASDARGLLREAIAVQAQIAEQAGESTQAQTILSPVSQVMPAEDNIFTITMGVGDESLSGLEICPGDDVPFMTSERADNGQLAALFHMRRQAYYIGYYFDPCGCPECPVGEDSIRLEYANPEYGHECFMKHEVTVIGINPCAPRRVN